MEILELLLHKLRLLAGLTDGEKYIVVQPVILLVAETLALYASTKRKARERIMLIWMVFATVGAATAVGLLYFKL
jgi:hypothetical protein